MHGEIQSLTEAGDPLRPETGNRSCRGKQDC
jgi:hypothetical protein